jgi:hypothetical protein
MFSVSESGCAPSSFTATSESPGTVGVSGNDGTGTFTVTAIGAPIVHGAVDVTDCHGFTTTKSTTPPSVKVQIVN